ncbi:MAG: WD40 repeat domain-containing protein [Verrucomicrobiota bacterium]
MLKKRLIIISRDYRRRALRCQRSANLTFGAIILSLALGILAIIFSRDLTRHDIQTSSQVQNEREQLKRSSLQEDIAIQASTKARLQSEVSDLPEIFENNAWAAIKLDRNIRIIHAQRISQNRVILVSSNGEVREFDLSDDKISNPLQISQTSIITATQGYTPETILFSTDDGVLTEYNIETKIRITSDPLDGGFYTDICQTSSKGVLAGSSSGAIHLWREGIGSSTITRITNEEVTDMILAVCIDPVTETVWSSCSNGKLYNLSLEGALLGKQDLVGGLVYDIHVSQAMGLGLAVGKDASLYQRSSTDRFEWDQIPFEGNTEGDVGISFFSADFDPNGQFGIITGSGVGYLTSDLGKSWRRLPIPNNRTYLGVLFGDTPEDLLAFGDNGELLVSVVGKRRRALATELDTATNRLESSEAALLKLENSETTRSASSFTSSEAFFHIAVNATRIGILLILIFLVQILLNVYRYNTKMASFYLCRSDAIGMVASLETVEEGEFKLDSLVGHFSTAEISLDKSPNAPTEHVAKLVTSILSSIKK